MKRYRYIFLLVLTAVSLFSCKEEDKTLRLLKVSEHTSAKVSDTALVRLLRLKDDIKIKIDYTLSEDFAYEELEKNNYDLMIMPNNAPSKNADVRTLVPLLPRIMVVLTDRRVDGMNLKEIFEKGAVYFDDRSRLDTIVYRKMYYNFNIDEAKIDSRTLGDIRVEEPSEKLRVYTGLTHVNNLLVKILSEKGWHFYSLGDVNYYGKGSRVEGFTMMNTSAHPFIIPMSVFRGKPKRSVLTFAINDILICKSSMDDKMAYDIAKTLIENKSQLIQMDDIFNLLDFNFNDYVFTFPIHKGVEQYINRDEPPEWYKYVKMIWPLISISVVVFGVIASLRQRLKRRKKQNIEMYYNHLLDIRDKTDTTKEIDDLIVILKELKSLRAEAMRSLAEKKLDPGESFNIFLALYNEVRNDLIESIRELREKMKEKD